MNQTEAANIVLVLNRAGLVQAMEGQAAVWAMALEDVSYVTAQEVARAMVKGRTSDMRWVTPGDIRSEVARLRKQRTSALGVVNPPAELADRVADTITWQRAYVEAIGDGDEPDIAEKRACDVVGIAVPPQLDRPRKLSELGRLVPRPPETDAPTDTQE